MKKRLTLLFLLGIIFLFSSCGVNSYVMFRTSKKDIVSNDIPISPADSYRLAKDDKINFLLFTEGGKNIIDLSASIDEETGNVRLTRGAEIEYQIQKDGTAELPILGWVELEKLTIIEAQNKLKELYSEYYIDPFIQLSVTNKRVLVFPGSGGTAKVVPILNENTTLMEAIASAGGLTERGRASRIKVMRLTDEGRKVYQVDLSTLDGLAYADMVVQANDYIYVEPTKQLTREFLKEVTPVISLITSAILVISIITSIN